MKELVFQVNTFPELNTTQLYEILRLRSEVFVVEQDCVYQDIDGKDQQAIHVLGYIGTELVAYARCFAPGIYFEEAAIGRIVTDARFRGNNFGHALVERSIWVIKNRYETTAIKISAQQYLISFYNSLGFLEVGEGYLEDGIPHIAMQYKEEH